VFTLLRPIRDEPETPTELRELYRDDWLLVVDKPAGLPLHPSARYQRGTVVALLRERHGEGFADPAHRVDRETSALLLCGRGLEASRRLMRSFGAGDVEKAYLGLCEGHPNEDTFTIDAPIALGTEAVRIAVRIDATSG